ncbi:MAG TPA: glycosyltransferase family 4 protein [Capsulimonadaceae bacterium]|nr:glycosyltransferase family 4 protein [Capsulimonadaceae bacterium]
MIDQHKKRQSVHISSPNRHPRILHLITEGVIAGAEQALVELADAHDAAAWDVRFATLFPAGEMNKRIEDLGGTCYALQFHRTRDLPATAIRLARLIDKHEIDILHTHLVHAGMAGVLARRLCRRSLHLAHTRHHSDALYQFGARFGLPYKAKVDGFIARRQDAVCAVSKAARDILVERERVRPDRVRIVYPGANIARLRSRVTEGAATRVRAEFGVAAGQPLLGVIAHLVPKKGHHYLLEAMPAVLARFPGARLVLVGRGDELARLEAEVQRLALGQSIIFAGYRTDVPDIITALDLVVQPSLEEGLPLSLIESMALAKPVVATAISGIPEVVEHGKTGLLAPSADSPALADAIIELLSDPDRRCEMGRLGETRARAAFDVSRLARHYEEVWSTILNNSGR